MTDEEINNVKVGDKIRLELTVAEVDGKEVYLHYADGTFFVRATTTTTGGILFYGEKVEPLRVFGVGDVVKIIPDSLTCTVYGEGRKLSFYPECLVTVASSANEVGDVIIQNPSGARQVVNTHCLKLIKRAEKDKFYVRHYFCQSLDFDAIDDGLDNLLDDGWGVCDKETLDTIVYFADSYPNAEAAARAECNRLNKDWRDKQNN